MPAMIEATRSPVHAGSPGRNDPCWCGSGRKYKKCHLSSDRAGRTAAPGREPAAAPAPAPSSRSGLVLKGRDEIEGIRRAGHLTRSILAGLDEVVRPGVTTGEIDAWVHERMAEAGARPATLNYKGFPASSCTSIDEVVCHGIPGRRALRAGEIINVDVTSVLDGFYGDASNMYLVGEVSEEAARLVRVTLEALERGIAAVRPGGRMGDVGAAIQTHAESHGYSVVRTFGGHGIGRSFHEEPFVPHYGKAGTGEPLIPGMVFTIEPMLNQGTWKVKVLDDGWTAVTADGKLSAQWEHTVAVSEDGVDVLTA
jgi:methionyl aminopeptidase